MSSYNVLIGLEAVAKSIDKLAKAHEKIAKALALKHVDGDYAQTLIQDILKKETS